MDKKQELYTLAERIINLPYRDKGQLDLFLVDLESQIIASVNDSTKHLEALQSLKFAPDSFYSTEEDYRSSWQSGVSDTVELINAVLSDPEVKGKPVSYEPPETSEDLSLDPISQNFQSSIIEESENIQTQTEIKPEASEAENTIIPDDLENTETVLNNISTEKEKKEKQKEEVIDKFLDELLDTEIKEPESKFSFAKYSIPAETVPQEPHAQEDKPFKPEPIEENLFKPEPIEETVLEQIEILEPGVEKPLATEPILEEPEQTDELKPAEQEQQLTSFLQNVSTYQASLFKKLKKNTQRFGEFVNQQKDSLALKAKSISFQSKPAKQTQTASEILNSETDQAMIEKAQPEPTPASEETFHFSTDDLNAADQEEAQPEALSEPDLSIATEQEEPIEPVTEALLEPKPQELEESDPEDADLEENLVQASKTVNDDLKAEASEPIQEDITKTKDAALEEKLQEAETPGDKPIPNPEAAKFTFANRVFLLSNTEDKLSRTVLNTLGRIGVEVVQLKDEKNTTKTLQQKGQQYYDVNFAVVVLSSDNWVYQKDGKPTDATIQTDQGIIFELGYWVGKLGRERVIVLYQEKYSFRRPTGFFEVLYLPIDKEGQWKLELAQRLEKMDYKINIKRLETEGL